MAKLNYLSTGYTITDETVSRTSSTASRIGHDLIKATGFEIWTGSGKTGTQLTLTTDYVLSAEATDYTTKVGSTIYTKLAIVNGAYLNTTLYISYVTVGDYASVENVKELSWDTCKTAAQWTSDNTILGLGETGRETDTGKEKTGDGSTAWNSLGYSLTPLSSTPSAGKVMVWPDSVAIVESGSNAYGSWIKFCDGTMILRGKITTVVGTNTYTLPQSPYNSSDADGGSSTSHSYVPVAGVDGTNLAWHENRTLKVVATVANNYMTWAIICRWKA